MKANFFLKTDIDHHGPNYIPIICHPPDPPTFSLVPTFKARNSRRKNNLNCPKMAQIPFFSCSELLKNAVI